MENDMSELTLNDIEIDESVEEVHANNRHFRKKEATTSTQDVTCYKCGKQGHIKPEYPKLSKKGGFKSKKDFKNKKAYLAWEDNEISSSSGSDSEEFANFALMASHHSDDEEEVLATILTLWLADKSGRRLLLIVSSSAMALSLLVVSISFYLKEYISPDSDLYATLSLVSVAGVVVMVIAFSLGLGAMPWIIMSEILPINIKGLAGSFATLANWFFSWLVTLTANLLLDWSSGGSVLLEIGVVVEDLVKVFC
ncbi:sugar transporter ERD6-like 6 [Lathyrus oleraceus]|uniref:sugar transporter ERD6-like 6 n=1 Tax=Pisum sativum TaxID=3888 RepID=UPI0021CEF0A1|nr:sugar transporter ERD6-like 6 [Pisum sativum]